MPMEVRVKIVLFSHLSNLGHAQMSPSDALLSTEFCKYLILKFENLEQDIDPDKEWQGFLLATNKKSGQLQQETAPESVTIRVSPVHGSPGQLTKEDVWGNPDHADDHGMIVARGLPDVDGKYFTQEEHSKLSKRLTNICPVWGDALPYKSVTLVCQSHQVEQVSYWAEYVHGGGCISNIKDLPEGKVALRSNYTCW